MVDLAAHDIHDAGTAETFGAATIHRNSLVPQHLEYRLIPRHSIDRARRLHFDLEGIPRCEFHFPGDEALQVHPSTAQQRFAFLNRVHHPFRAAGIDVASRRH